jgi:hypothetical protein
VQPQEIVQQLENPWHKAYWFARMLINSDKYGGIARENKVLLSITSALRLVSQESKNKAETLPLQKQALKNILDERYSKAKSRKKLVERLWIDLNTEITSSEEMRVFILTCEHIVMPTNQAIINIPSDDKIYTESLARTFLDVQGQKGLATVVNLWDDLGVKGCLNAERVEVVKAFATLRLLLTEEKISDGDKDVILTAFVQEFERRAGQKRKGRAGGSLEDVTSFILDYYNIPPALKPEHFQADIEVDNWVKTKDGWLIGISCKRTLRERWKQVSSADRAVLSKYKIKYVYHVITFDEDLSDEKLTLLGSQSHVFYLPDSSRRLERAVNHVGLHTYVRPITELVNDLRREME